MQPNLKKLIIIGAGGVAFDIIDCVNDINKSNPTWEIVGLLDDDKSKHGTDFYLGTKVLGDSEQISKYISAGCSFLVSFSSPNHFFKRSNYIQSLLEKYPTIQFANVIHPKAYISPSATLGCGLFLAQDVYIGAKAKINDHCIVLFSSIVSRFVELGKYCFLSANVNITGNKKIGDLCYLGVKSTINTDLGSDLLVSAGTFLKKKVEGPAIVFSNVSTEITEFKSLEKMNIGLSRL